MPAPGYTLIQQQVEQLLRLLPSASKASSKTSNSYETNEETDYTFTGTVYSCTPSKFSVWILDIGATDHMSLVADCLKNLTGQGDKSHIKLPNGTLAAIDKIGFATILWYHFD